MWGANIVATLKLINLKKLWMFGEASLRYVPQSLWSYIILLQDISMHLEPMLQHWKLFNLHLSCCQKQRLSSAVLRSWKTWRSSSHKHDDRGHIYTLLAVKVFWLPHPPQCISHLNALGLQGCLISIIQCPVTSKVVCHLAFTHSRTIFACRIGMSMLQTQPCWYIWHVWGSYCAASVAMNARKLRAASC